MMNCTFRYKRLIPAFVIAVLYAGLHGCSSSDNGGSVQPTLTSLWDNYFDGCALNCHSPTGALDLQKGPDLSTKNSFYLGLVNKNIDDYPEWNKASNCDSVSFITPNNANQSSMAASLILSVSDTLEGNVNCTSSYGLHAFEQIAFPNQEIADALIAWINNGAQNN